MIKRILAALWSLGDLSPDTRRDLSALDWAILLILMPIVFYMVWALDVEPIFRFAAAAWAQLSPAARVIAVVGWAVGAGLFWLIVRFRAEIVAVLRRAFSGPWLAVWMLVALLGMAYTDYHDDLARYTLIYGPDAGPAMLHAQWALATIGTLGLGLMSVIIWLIVRLVRSK